MRPLAPAPPSTVCRRSTSPSTICTRKAWSAMKPPWRTPAIRTTSSSKCRAFTRQQTLRVSRWSKPDLAPEERKLKTEINHQELPTGDVVKNVSFIFCRCAPNRLRFRSTLTAICSCDSAARRVPGLAAYRCLFRTAGALACEHFPQLPKSPELPKIQIEDRGKILQEIGRASCRE